jgi:hypothetical protein
MALLRVAAAALHPPGSCCRGLAAPCRLLAEVRRDDLLGVVLCSVEPPRVCGRCHGARDAHSGQRLTPPPPPVVPLSQVFLRHNRITRPHSLVQPPGGE